VNTIIRGHGSKNLRENALRVVCERGSGQNVPGPNVTERNARTRLELEHDRSLDRDVTVKGMKMQIKCLIKL